MISVRRFVLLMLCLAVLSLGMVPPVGAAQGDTIWVLNEVSPLGDGSAGHDWVEIYVRRSGTPTDLYLEFDSSDTIPLSDITAELPADTTIVVHGTTGTSDTDTVDGGSGDNAGDTYWDVYDDSLSLTGTNDYVFLRNGNDRIVDAIIWDDQDGTLDQQSALSDAINAGEWGRQAQTLVELDALTSQGNSRRVYYRNRVRSDTNSRYGWDYIPASITLGGDNDDATFNANTGSGTAPRRPQGVVASGFSGFSFDVEYTGEHEFGTNGREGYVTERIPKGFPDPTFNDPSAPGYTTITASEDSLNDSGIFVRQSGDTVIWVELIAGVTGFDPGDTVEIRYGNPDDGGPGLSVSGSGSDTFWVHSDPTGNNYDTLPNQFQPTLVRSSPDTLDVSPSSKEVAAGDVVDFASIVRDAAGNRLLGAGVEYVVAEKPDGADSATMIDTDPGDGISNKNGKINYRYQTDTGSSGTYKIRTQLVSDPSIADTMTITVDFEPVALGTSRLIADTFVTVSLADLGTDDRSWLLYNPTSSPVDLSGYWIARYTSSRAWNSPTSDVRIGSLSLNNASNYTIEPGGWYLIGRDATAVPEADAIWGDLVIGTGYGFAVFPQDPNNYGSSQEASDNRVDAVGFENSQNVFESDTVPNNPTSANLPHRRPDTEPGAFIDRQVNSRDIDQPTGKDVRKNTASDTVRPGFELSGPDSVRPGDAFTVSGTATVRLRNGLQSDSIVNDYDGDSAWAEVFVDRGNVSPDTTGTFSSGRVDRNFKVTDTSGTVTLSFVDGVAQGAFRLTVNEPPSVKLVGPDTDDLVGGDDVPGTYVVTDPDNDPGTVTVEVSTDSGATWDTEATLSGEVASVSSSAKGDTHTFRWDALGDLGTIYDTEVRLRARVTDGIDISGYDTTGAFTVDNRAPPRVNDLGSTAALETSDTGVSLFWSRGTDDVENYRVYRADRTADTLLATFLDTAPLSGDTQTYLDPSATQGDSYFYYVTVEDTAGNESDSSNVTTAPNVRISKTQDDTGSHRPGDTIFYTIEYTNNGFGPTGEIQLIDAVPDTTVLSDTAIVLNPPPDATIEYSTDGGSSWQSSSYPRGSIDRIRWTITEDVDPRASGTTGRMRFRVRLQ